MPIEAQLIGASVEAAPPRLDLVDPIVDRPLPGGSGHFVADRRRALVRVDGVATFAIEDGRRVRFKPEPGAAQGRIAMWLHGTVAALVLAQRGRFALHASVVDIDGRSVALTGPRRVGKSTTALRLAQRGHSLVTDDVSPLQSAGRVTVHPFARPVHVFAETADELGLDVSDASRLFADHPKLALPPPSLEPVRLGAIAVLEAEPTSKVRSAPVAGAQAHWLVAANVYRLDLLRELWQAEMFDWAAAIAGNVPVHAVIRPIDAWSVDAVADAIERLIGNRNAS